jgi:hypothetical protein
MGLPPPPPSTTLFFFFCSTIIIVMHQKWSHSLKSNIRFNKRVLGFRDRTSAAFESLVPHLGRFILLKGKLTFEEQK